MAPINEHTFNREGDAGACVYTGARREEEAVDEPTWPPPPWLLNETPLPEEIPFFVLNDPPFFLLLPLPLLLPLLDDDAAAPFLLLTKPPFLLLAVQLEVLEGPKEPFCFPLFFLPTLDGLVGCVLVLPCEAGMTIPLTTFPPFDDDEEDDDEDDFAAADEEEDDAELDCDCVRRDKESSDCQSDCGNITRTKSTDCGGLLLYCVYSFFFSHNKVTN